MKQLLVYGCVAAIFAGLRALIARVIGTLWKHARKIGPKAIEFLKYVTRIMARATVNGIKL